MQSLFKLMLIDSVIQSSHPLSPPSPPALNLSQHQGLFQWVSSSHQVAKLFGASASASVLPVNIQDWFPLGLTGLMSLLFKWFQESSPAPQFQSTNYSALSLFYGSALISLHDYWKNHSFDYTDYCWQSDVSAFWCLKLKNREYKIHSKNLHIHINIFSEKWDFLLNTGYSFHFYFK